MKITILNTIKNTVYAEAVLTETEVAFAKELAVDKLIRTITVKGFRQGKAPRSVAIDHLDPDKLSSQVLNHLLNNVVSSILKKNNFRLLGRPVLEDINSKDQPGWTIKLAFPLYPEINAEGYQNYLPKLGKSKQKGLTTDTKEQKIENIYRALLKNIKFDLPGSILEEEVNYSLRRLENQSKTLNFTLEKYLEAVKKTLDQVKSEYSEKAEEAIKIDLIMLEIAKIEKITTTPKEIDSLATAGGVSKDQLDQLRTVIQRRKTIEFLLKLC